MPKNRTNTNTTFSDVVSVTPTIDTQPYSAGDRLGSVHYIKLATRLKGQACNLTSIHINDLSSQNAAFNILFFDDLPKVASADNEPLDLADGEIRKCIGMARISSEYVTTGRNSVTTAAGVSLVLRAMDSSACLYAVVEIASDATFDRPTALTFKYGFSQN